jgi:tRNA pseudouridine55 synthase
MGRVRKGRQVSGWLVVDKPAGMTSTAVVNKVKWAFGAQKAGHAGTLDPDATGVLAVALGEATKTVPYVTDALKAYDFDMRFGQATTTDDAEGEVVATSDLRPSDAAIKEALHGFVGEIMQVPPAFSAVKVDGARAYDLARDGEVVELAARPLWVEELVMTGRPDADHATLEMTCGKGGYVRSVARDLGRVLGCLGHVTRLRRVWSGPFRVEDGVTLEEIERLAGTAEIDALLLPLEAGLAGLPELRCPAESVARLRNGNPGMVWPGEAEFGDLAWVSHEGRAVAVGQVRGSELHPVRVFAAGAGESGLTR